MIAVQSRDLSYEFVTAGLPAAPTPVSTKALGLELGI